MKKLKSEPQEIVASYLLHLYCKYENGFYLHDSTQGLAEVVGQTKAQAFKEARDLGWTIHKNETATCPLCAKLS